MLIYVIAIILSHLTVINFGLLLNELLKMVISSKTAYKHLTRLSSCGVHNLLQKVVASNFKFRSSLTMTLFIVCTLRPPPLFSLKSEKGTQELYPNFAENHVEVNE